MADTRYTLAQRTQEAPLRSLKVEVVQGPNQGQLCETESETITVGSVPGNDLVLNDETVSRYHLELKRENDRILVQDCGSTNGVHIGQVQVHQATVPPGTVLRLGNTNLKIEDGDAISIPVLDRDEFHGLRGVSEGMRRLMAQIERVAKSNVSVLLLGETGTGKEKVAKALHEASPRAKQPLEIVDCGSLMPTLVASELFGHEKGAFTGAERQYIGAFERANGGTIFLDEIGELPANLQVRLLGALERRSFRRVGGSKTINVDVRVVSATHRDLRKWVNSGEFRQDLYYRIAVARLVIPALRDRPDDVPLLVDHFLDEMGLGDEANGLIPESIKSTLKTYHWPGNVRELRNFVESAVAFGEPPPMDAELAEHAESDDPHKLSVGGLLEHPYREARDVVLHGFQEIYFKALLERTGGNVSHAATKAQMSRPHLIQLIKRYGLR